MAFIGTYAYLLGANDFEVSVVAVAGSETTALLATRLGSRRDSLGEIRGYVYGFLPVVGSLVVYMVAQVWPDLIPRGTVYAAEFGLPSPAMLSSESWARGGEQDDFPQIEFLQSCLRNEKRYHGLFLFLIAKMGK